MIKHILIISVIVACVMLSLYFTGVLGSHSFSPAVSTAPITTQKGPLYTTPKIILFTASQMQINRGNPINISWDVSGADFIIIYPKIGTVAASGSTEVFPDTDTTYTLTASHGDMVVSKSLIIKVNAQQPAHSENPAMKLPINMTIVIPDKLNCGDIVTQQITLQNTSKTTLNDVVLYVRFGQYSQYLFPRCDKPLSTCQGGFMLDIGDLAPDKKNISQFTFAIPGFTLPDIDPIPMSMSCDYDNAKNQYLGSLIMTLDHTRDFFSVDSRDLINDSKSQ